MPTIEHTILAPAKINLNLRILGRRPDGYHLLDSLMVPISLYDELSIKLITPPTPMPLGPEIAVTSDSDAAPGGPTNLAYRAAALFLEAVKRPLTVNIGLRKRIPVGSGLGGGSSDAAAVLLFLNRALGFPIPIQQLAELAAQIGADVTFFVHGRPARVTGTGEHIAPLHSGISLPLVVCSDGQFLSTRLVYSQVDLSSLTTEVPVSNIDCFVNGCKPMSELLQNDLEAAAARIHPEVLSLKAKLVEQGALGALMTGSGSAVFGVWPDQRTAERAAKMLRDHGLWAEAVHTLDASPAVSE